MSAALVVMLVAVLTGCGQAAPSPAPQASVQPAEPGPAPTDIPTETPQLTATPVPTNTPAPTATAIPDTPTPSPTSTSTPRPTSTPQPPYPPNAYERLGSLKSYHLQFTVSAASNQYSLAGDEATPNYHLVVNSPLSPPAELFFVNGRYVWSVAGTPFVDSGSTPPPQAAILEAAEAFARDWLDHPDSATFKGTEQANGVRANHFVLTWKAGRQVALGPLSSTTYDPTTGDIWLEAASGAPVKTSFSMRVSNGGEVSTITSQSDVTNINQPVAITPPPAQKAPARA